MEITRLYGFAAVVLVSTFLLAGISLALWQCVPGLVKENFRKFARLLAHCRAFKPEFATLCMYFFVIGNALCVSIALPTNAGRVSISLVDTVRFTRRLGNIALANMILLYASGRMNSVASICGIRYQRYSWIHNRVGVVVIVEVGLHSVLEGWREGVKAHTKLAGVLASVAFGIILVSSFPKCRIRVFELFSHAHSILANAILIALWYHITPSTILKSPRSFIFLAGLVSILLRLLRICQTIYTSVSWRGVCTAEINGIKTVAVGDLAESFVGFEIELRLARYCQFRPGQYVYLNLPTQRFPWRIFQWHPFQVSWTYRDGNEDVIVLIVQPRKGFTAKLLPDKVHRGKYKAFIEGPYGKSISVQNYDTAILFATGIGITGQLLYVKRFLEHHSVDAQCDQETERKRVVLIWEVDADVHRFWANEWMLKLMALDIRKDTLDIKVFITGRTLATKVPKDRAKKHGLHDRLETFYYPMSTRSEIAKELHKRNGRTLISTCVDQSRTKEIRQAIKSHPYKDIHLEELEFFPCKSSGLESFTSLNESGRRHSESSESKRVI